MEKFTPVQICLHALFLCENMHTYLSCNKLIYLLSVQHTLKFVRLSSTLFL